MSRLRVLYWAGPRLRGLYRAGPRRCSQYRAGPRLCELYRAGPRLCELHSAGPRRRGLYRAGPRRRALYRAGPRRRGSVWLDTPLLTTDQVQSQPKTTTFCAGAGEKKWCTTCGPFACSCTIRILNLRNSIEMYLVCHWHICHRFHSENFSLCTIFINSCTMPG